MKRIVVGLNDLTHPRSDAIERFMTRDPVCIDANQPISDAYQRMIRTGCRHLPLLLAGKLVGVVSLRGLCRLDCVDGLSRVTRPVFDAVEEPFVVVPGTPVIEVAAQMAASGYQAALVVDRGEVVGIFTEADAIRALVPLTFRLGTRATTT